MMNSDKYLRWFIIFLIVNLIVSLLYLLFGMIFNRTSRKKVAMRSLIMLYAPGIGPLLFFISYLFYRLLFYRKVDLSDVVFSKEKSKELVRINEDKERDFVPVEEAIEVADKGELRELVLNMAQGDYSESLSAINMALNAEDTETSHYAASILQDAINDFRMLVRKENARIYDIDEEDESKREQLIYDIKKLFVYMNKVLEQHILSKLEQNGYTDILDKLLEKYYRLAGASITSEMYESMALRLIETEKYDRARSWCERALWRYPNTLASYTTLIKLYFSCGDRENFFKTMQELKESNIVIDRETLELIRAFQ
ncbi:hypothetical protein [Lacrimispora saccharolytica]|uniref:hypothetical protein n=1 Tax=Lacrimispora saccharolytica TaxID=84030 RepID=UPI00265CC84C|nr:hypothetical protein [Lacrimispora saccharolytica]MCF2656379.1 hypothetical protein [Lacrimispora saccharolytica]